MGSIFVIIFRNKNRIGFVSDDTEGNMMTFASEAEAEAAARNTTCCKAFPYQIVEVEC